MMSKAILVLTVLSILGCGLASGAFFAFSSFVMKSLKNLPTSQAVAAMQSINLTVLRSSFMAVFLGTAGACLVLGASSLIRWELPGSACLPAGCLLYLLGTFLVTAMGNVPLNQTLAAVAADGEESESFWANYLRAWTFWNHIRAAAALAASLALISSLLIHGGKAH
jgi:uncharacterized membrane protein